MALRVLLLLLLLYILGVLAEDKSSAEFRLVGGASRCEGTVEVEHEGEWRRGWTFWSWGFWDPWDLEAAAAVCRDLDCGSALSVEHRGDFPESPVWEISPDCVKKFTVKECVRSEDSSSDVGLNVKCSELRLVGGASRCAGTVEVKHEGEWGRVQTFRLPALEAAAAVCRDLDCGSAVSGKYRDGFPQSRGWGISPFCVKKSTVKECVMGVAFSSPWGLDVVCSDSVNRPIISLSVIDGVSEAQLQGVRVQLGSKFRVKCSVETQFPGGSFQLLSPTQNHTLPAVNHSAHFLFTDAGPAHKGNYTCVYHLQVFHHAFSSQSSTLQLSLGDLTSNLIIRVLVILLLKLMYILPLYYYYCKVRARGGARERPQL